MKHLFVFVSVMFVFFGCGADEEAPFEVSEKAPVVSVEKVGQEITGTLVTATYKVVADAAPKNDLLVNVFVTRWDYDFGTDPCEFFRNYYNPWVTIPKGKKESQEIQAESVSLNAYMYAEIEPLPIISVVGEGEVIDQQSLQNEYGGDGTADGKKIPENFVFPYYEVSRKNAIVVLYQPGKAQIINIDPPPGSFVPLLSEIKLTFDAPPECPGASWGTERAKALGRNGSNGTEFYIIVPYRNIRFEHFKPVSLTISWGKEKAGTAASESFEYKLINR